MSNWPTLADKRSAIHVEDEWTKGDLGGHGRTLADVRKISEFFGAQFKTFQRAAGDPAAVGSMSPNRRIP